MAKSSRPEASRTVETQDSSERASGLAPFAFRIEEPRCRGVLITSLKSTQAIRSDWSLAILNAHGGSDVGGTMQRMPSIPGIEVHVNPRTRVVEFIDPLEHDQDLLDRINAIVADVVAIGPAGGKSFRAVPKQTVKLSVDEFKTFLIEIAYFDGPDSDWKLIVTSGTIPTIEEIEKLPGRELFDVRSNSHIQPKYRDDVEKWFERLVK